MIMPACENPIALRSPHGKTTAAKAYSQPIPKQNAVNMKRRQQVAH
jgi:hypothetical protein